MISGSSRFVPHLVGSVRGPGRADSHRRVEAERVVMSVPEADRFQTVSS